SCDSCSTPEVILEKLYNGEVHNDAVFIVDTPSDMSASAEGSDISSGSIPDTNMDTVTSSEYQQDLGMDLINPDEGSDRVEPYAK
ncbi:hypothetical protein CPB97_006506, partial [Podila verticillata]